MAQEGERGGRFGRGAGSVVLLVLGIAAGVVWFVSGQETRERLPGGDAELVVRARPWLTATQALCLPGAACVDVRTNDVWEVVLGDPLVVRGGSWMALRDEVVLDPATGRELGRAELPPSEIAFGAMARPIRAGEVVLELLPAPSGSVVRVFDAHTGDVRFEQPVALSALAEIVPVDEMTFRIDGGDAIYELTMPAGPLRSIVPTGATSACLVGDFLFSARDGTLGLAGARGESDGALARPGPGRLTGCAVVRDLAVVAWQHTPARTSGDVETVLPLAPDAGLEAGLALYVLDATSRALRYAVALPGADSANLETCRPSPGDEVRMGECHGDVGIRGADHAAVFDLGPDGLVLR